MDFDVQQTFELYKKILDQMLFTELAHKHTFCEVEY